jgi:clan AA aspartic protease (TIGR02281 family)
VQTASKLIEARPHDAEGYLLRAEAYEVLREPARAEADYRQAFELAPSKGQVAERLSDLLAERRRHCEAADVLDAYAARARQSEDEDRARRSARRLREVGRCRDARAAGGEVLVAGQLTLANRLGLDTREGARMLMSTASGIVAATVVELDSVEVGGARLERVRAAVVDGLGHSLLGNSFLSRFDVHIDLEGSRLRLKARR